MPQGNKKSNKGALPSGLLNKKKDKLHTAARKNRPIAPKKNKHIEAQNLKKMITKNVNRVMEEQIRSIANDSQRVHLSKKKDKFAAASSNKMPPMETS
ncbi:hypothetical protein O3M35_010118 [Rhynocoris fuscipes]|uniref:Uncharacterized protein n=1 Tax=Rhynocoris fuscipes TaxID=488301 RepID=A0AAW1D1C3_9HEMI